MAGSSPTLREPTLLHRVLVALLAAFIVALSLPATPVSAASTAKVVVVVGPVGSLNSHYKADANDIVAEAKRYTSNVVKIVTPNATWSRVKAAMQGASVFVYLGHGNGWPSIYGPFQTLTKDGLGLDPSTGADGVKTVYYGEDYLREHVRFAPNAVVLLYHLCYASGNTEPGLKVGTLTDSRERVDNYGAGFIGAGARAVFAEGHPNHPATSYIRQLFATDRTMDGIFRAAPTWHDNLLGPYASMRTPGLRYQLDPDTAAPAGFYRSVIGDLSLRASKVTRTAYPDTGAHPAAFVVPGAAEVTSGTGVPLFATAAAAADPAAASPTTLAAATKLRLESEAAPAPDGTRVFAASVAGSSTTGFVRATGIAPRDSAATEFRSFDESNAWLSPNDDGTHDAWAVMARFSEVVTASFSVKNAAGSVVKSGSVTSDLARFGWDLRTGSGALVPDGAYTWAVRGRDAWGNGTAYRTGAFTVDGTPPTTKATPAYTQGENDWIASPVSVTLAAKDALSGVASISWRLDGGSATRYGTTPAVVKANGVHTFGYRAVDKAGVRESWRYLTFRIDDTAPTIAAKLTGAQGVAGQFRGPVTVTPSFDDNASGVTTKTVAVDGADAAPLTTGSFVVDGEGQHSVVLRARDAAGNARSRTVSFVIDTVAPVVTTTPAAEGAAPPVVTPNGDGVTDSIALPFSASEAATVTATVLAPDGATVVRTVSADAAAGDGRVTWDGRNAAGKPVTDGRYTVTLAATDPAGNVGPAAGPLTVDVFGALASLARTPSQFYPQDGDTLATKAKATWTMRSPATVTVEVRNETGVVVRTAYADRALAAGAYAWSWNGKADDGTYAPRGRYRIVVQATNGTQSATQSVAVVADAFKLTTSVTTAVRGTRLVLTARTSEALSTTPVVYVYEPGLTVRTVTMTKSTSTTWTAKLTPRTSAGKGTLTLKVKARDSLRGVNLSAVRLPLK